MRTAKLLSFRYGVKVRLFSFIPLWFSFCIGPKKSTAGSLNALLFIILLFTAAKQLPNADIQQKHAENAAQQAEIH